MDYENFKEQFVEDVNERLYEQGTEIDITVTTVNKLNESYEAMTVKPEGTNIRVNIGINKFYGATQDGISYDDVVDKAVKAISDGFLNQPQIDVASLTDYDQMKDKLVMEVVSAETNKEMDAVVQIFKLFCLKKESLNRIIQKECQSLFL